MRCSDPICVIPISETTVPDARRARIMLSRVFFLLIVYTHHPKSIGESIQPFRMPSETLGTSDSIVAIPHAIRNRRMDMASGFENSCAFFFHSARILGCSIPVIAIPIMADSRKVVGMPIMVKRKRYAGTRKVVSTIACSHLVYASRARSIRARTRNIILLSCYAYMRGPSP